MKMIEVFSNVRMMLITSVFIGGSIGWLVSENTTPIYASISSVKIGTLSKLPQKQDIDIDESSSHLIESVEDIVAILRARYRIREAKTGLLDPPYLYSISNNSVSPIIELSARGSSPRNATEFLNSVTTWLVERHKKKIDKTVEDWRYQKEAMSKLIASITKQMATQYQEGGRDQVPQSKEIVDRSLALVSALTKISVELEVNLERLRYENTQVLLEAIPRNKKIKPKPLLYILTGAISCCMAMLIILVVYRSGVLRVDP